MRESKVKSEESNVEELMIRIVSASSIEVLRTIQDVIITEAMHLNDDELPLWLNIVENVGRLKFQKKWEKVRFMLN